MKTQKRKPKSSASLVQGDPYLLSIWSYRGFLMKYRPPKHGWYGGASWWAEPGFSDKRTPYRSTKRELMLAIDDELDKKKGAES